MNTMSTVSMETIATNGSYIQRQWSHTVQSFNHLEENTLKKSNADVRIIAC